MEDPEGVTTVRKNCIWHRLGCFLIWPVFLVQHALRLTFSRILIRSPRKQFLPYPNSSEYHRRFFSPLRIDTDPRVIPFVTPADEARFEGNIINECPCAIARFRHLRHVGPQGTSRNLQPSTQSQRNTPGIPWVLLFHLLGPPQDLLQGDPCPWAMEPLEMFLLGRRRSQFEPSLVLQHFSDLGHAIHAGSIGDDPDLEPSALISFTSLSKSRWRVGSPPPSKITDKKALRMEGTDRLRNIFEG